MAGRRIAEPAAGDAVWRADIGSAAGQHVFYLPGPARRTRDLIWAEADAHRLDAAW